MTKRYSAQPTTNIAPVSSGSAAYGLSPKCEHAIHAPYIATISREPCAKLTMCSTP